MKCPASPQLKHKEASVSFSVRKILKSRPTRENERVETRHAQRRLLQVVRIYGIYTGHTPACVQRAVAEDVVESLTPARESTDEEHGADGACLLTPTPATIPASADVPTKEATEAQISAVP